MGILTLKIRRSLDRLIFNMGSPMWLLCYYSNQMKTCWLDPNLIGTKKSTNLFIANIFESIYKYSATLPRPWYIAQNGKHRTQLGIFWFEFPIDFLLAIIVQLKVRFSSLCAFTSIEFRGYKVPLSGLLVGRPSNLGPSGPPPTALP